MSEPARKRATYEDLYNIPENMTGEIINGELVVTPRPSRKHTSTASSLGYKLGPAYQFGEGGAFKSSSNENLSSRTTPHSSPMTHPQ